MQVELQPWITPNCVIAKTSIRPRQEGFKEPPMWSINEVDAETLAEQCDKFRAEIFSKAGKEDPAKGKT